jgi:hypothetical protein
MSPTAVVGGSVGQRAHYGGHTWVFLQYLLGFQDLGWDVLLVDRMQAEMCLDASGNPCPLESSVNLRYLDDAMRRFGLADSYTVLLDEDDGNQRSVGVPRERLLERVGASSIFLNLNGHITGEVLERAPFRVFLDIDPGFGHMWQELGLHEMFRDHHAYVTVGENVGKPECPIPTCGIDWITTPQPVVLDHWPARSGGDAFTSVGAWRGPSGPIEYRGETYGLRVHEFRRFVTLPRESGEAFEVALDIHSAEVMDLELLRENGWTLADPLVVAGDPCSYQAYVQGSKAEFMVAKNMYVKTRSGWFSDRSACYLASGKPVLAQDTGLEGLYPTGEGLLTFTTLEEAVAGANEIASDPRRHGEAARAIAEEFFDSRKVLPRLLSRLGVA